MVVNLKADDQRASRSQRTARNKRTEPMLLFQDEEKLPYTDPNAHYHIGKSTKYKLNIYQWPDEELAQDVAYKVSIMYLPSLHILINPGLVSETVGPSTSTIERHRTI